MKISRLLLPLAGVLVAAPALPAAAATLTTFNLASDYTITELTSSPNSTNTSARIGAGGPSGSVGGLAGVYVFALPTLAPLETVSTANLQFSYTSKQNSPSTSQNGDLYGIGFATVTTPLVEYYEGAWAAGPNTATGDSGNYGIQDNILTSTTTVGEVTTSAAGASALGTYLQTFYTSNPTYDASVPAYVFLRLNPDFNSSSILGYNVEMFEGVSGEQPKLTINTVPEPGGLLTITAVASSLFFSRRRRRVTAL